MAQNLNRMTASPGFTYSNSILGNRTATIPTTGGAGAMTWDVLNRMLTSTQADPGGASSTASMAYVYRADGMRVKKTLHSGVYQLGVTLSGTNEVDDVYTKYRYDGQMPIQTYVNKADSTTLETDQALGARGTDRVSLTNSSGTFISYPLYDAHGNEVLTLAKSGSSYTTGHQRSYGAWGEVRQGDTTGGPRARYCGNLGHVQDDETGLIYMRARYYDVASGRFVSEDPGMHSGNWYMYASNCPSSRLDASGKGDFWEAIEIAAMAALAAFTVSLAISQNASAALKSAAATFASAFVAAYYGEDLQNAIEGTVLQAYGGLIGFGINGLAGAAASWIIDMPTSDTDNLFSDIAHGFLGGGISGAFGGTDGWNASRPALPAVP